MRKGSPTTVQIKPRSGSVSMVPSNINEICWNQEVSTRHDRTTEHLSLSNLQSRAILNINEQLNGQDGQRRGRGQSESTSYSKLSC